MLRVGDRFMTSYGSGPYIVTKIMRGCTCPEYVRSLDGDETPSRPHVHIICREDPPRFERHEDLDFYVNGYDEETLHSVWREGDYLIPLQPQPGDQASLF